MKRVYDPEQQRIKEMQKLYASQKQKAFNYTIDDFDTAVLNAKLVYKRGDFMPRVKEIIRKEGNYIDCCLAD